VGEVVPGRPRRSPATNAAELHRQWLTLFDIEGPFLAVPALKKVWPNGIPDYRSNNPTGFDVFTGLKRDFEAAWESLDRNPDSDDQLRDYRQARDQWIEALLREVIGWAEALHWGPVPGVEAQSPNRAITVTAQGALRAGDTWGALVHIVDPTDSLRQTPNDLWAATPIDRLDAMLREAKLPIGIVTDGRWWGLVHATDGLMTASGVVDALTWVEEPRARDAFFTLISRQHIIGGDPDERLPALFVESVAAAEEITEALGAQVRRAVELLVQSFTEAAADAQRRGRPNPLPEQSHVTYEAAVTVMMRIVFLLFAEERGLLPSGELFEHGYGISSELDRLTSLGAAGEEALEATSLTWHRLLASGKALHQGATFENMRMPAYGGSLFDPERFEFLAATTEEGSLAISVSDRAMLHVLRSVQIASVKGEARRISFRDIDVEQIGYIYEGLLGYTCRTVAETYLGLIGKLGVEPEIPLAALEQIIATHPTAQRAAAAIIEWVKQDQPSAKPTSAAALTKALDAVPDAAAVSALTQIVGDDHGLIERITPLLSAVRTDLRGHPFVVLEGGLLVAETPSRKNAGAHYTPKFLAEEVVLHALEPLCFEPGPHQTSDESAWRLRSSDDLLSLKVADIACGSGAFLVAAARYLADRVVEAWVNEDPGNALRKDLRVRAVRQVVANCLYGADINDMAVEMCKLSLWLVSLDRDLPFSFVDDKIFHGNSLLGLTSLEQLRKLHIDPSRVPPDRKFDIYEVDIDEIIQKAVDLRERLATEIDDRDPARSAAAKQRQFHELERVTAALRRIADGAIAAGLPVGGKPGAQLDSAYEGLRAAVKDAYPESDQQESASGDLDRLIDRGLTPTVETDYDRWQPLHWVIEAPDVVIQHGGFDAVVGNPPFLGGKKISPALGSEMRQWMVSVVADGDTGNADMVAYFFRRAWSLLGPTGTLGLIATNTIAQGDSREVGLDSIVSRGFAITRAVQSKPWPVKSASLEYAAVWGGGSVDNAISRLSTLLEDEGRLPGLPKRLRESKGLAFKGVNINGPGFILPPAVAMAMIESDPSNAEVVKPYFVGADLNSSPNLDIQRWIVDFGLRDLSEIKRYKEPMEWVKARVPAQRTHLRNKTRLQEQWWRFEAPATGLRKATESLGEILAIAVVSKTVMPVRMPAHYVYDQATTVFTCATFADQAVLSSSIHQMWAIKYGSGLRTDPRYTPTDVFETFPRPIRSARLESIGAILHTERSSIMRRRELGLTKLYNLVNSSDLVSESEVDVARLREIHEEVDDAVLEAYGWTDVKLDRGFHSYRSMQRWTIGPSARIEIFDRLLSENHRRFALEEVDLRPTASSQRTKSASKGMEGMF
jgi:methylase of polypeptide subunit release factors